MRRKASAKDIERRDPTEGALRACSSSFPSSVIKPRVTALARHSHAIDLTVPSCSWARTGGAVGPMSIVLVGLCFVPVVAARNKMSAIVFASTGALFWCALSCTGAVPASRRF